jgi:anti-sigma factor RsiW
MSCSSSEELFERFLDGEISTAQRARLLAHVDRCASCRGMLEELRAVDALLLAPRRIELAPNFTFATMAEARTLPPPQPVYPPILAYLVSYLVAAWLSAGAALLLAPSSMHALSGTLVDIARSIADALAGFGTVTASTLGHGGGIVTAGLAAFLLVVDVALVFAFGAAFKFVRPRLAERLRP